MKERRYAHHLEEHYRCYELQPVGSYTYRGIKYTVAMTPEAHVIKYPTTEREREIAREFPNGYYDIAGAIFKDEEPAIGFSAVMDKYHDPMSTDRRGMRIAEARRVAEKAIDDGIYDYFHQSR